MSATEEPFQLALVQMPVSDDPDASLAHACGRVSDAADAGADVVCLPELFRSPYFCQSEDPAFFDLAEAIPGPSTEALAQVAIEAGVVIVAPIFERRAAGLYHNSLAVIDRDGSLAGLYRKMHIPDDPQYYEKFYFTPGDLGFRAIPTSVGKLGTLICWDQWFPEAARLTALQGAPLLLYPTAIGWLPNEVDTEEGTAQRDAWMTVQRGHAIANNVYVAAVNRVGFEPSGDRGADGIRFWGASFICDPQGRILAQAGADEEILMATIDPARVEACRRAWPFLRDRRIDAFEPLTRRFLD